MDIASLEIGIDGNWSAKEMGEELSALAFVYDLHRAIDHAEHSSDALNFYLVLVYGPPRDVWFYPIPGEPLDITSVHFASPGTQTFRGVAKTIDKVREWLEFFLHYDYVTQKNELDLEKRRQEIEAMRIKNFQATMNALKVAGFTKRQMHEIAAKWMKQEEVMQSIGDDQKITHVKVVADIDRDSLAG